MMVTREGLMTGVTGERGKKYMVSPTDGGWTKVEVRRVVTVQSAVLCNRVLYHAALFF